MGERRFEALTSVLVQLLFQVCLFIQRQNDIWTINTSFISYKMKSSSPVKMRNNVLNAKLI